MNRDELAGHLGGTAFPRPEASEPLLDGLFPEDDAVVRVARHELPVGGELDGSAGSLVDDVENATVGGDHRVDARHVLVGGRPEGLAGPLEAAREAAVRIIAHHVVGGVVLVVGPVGAGIVGGGLRGRPLVDAGFAEESAAGGEGAHGFLPGEGSAAREDNEVHEAVGMGKFLAGPELGGNPGGDGVVEPVIAEALPGAGDVRGIGVEAVDDDGGVDGGERGDEPAVAAAGVDDETAGGAAFLEEVEGEVGTGRGEECDGENCREDVKCLHVGGP